MGTTAFLAVAGFITLALITGGCDKVPAPKPAGPHPLPEPPRVAACQPGQPGGRLVLAATAPPGTFNPMIAFDNASDQIVRLLFCGLAQLDCTKQEVVPGLAEAWSVSADGKTWTFKLRRGLHWSDGQPLTAADVLFTWNDVMYNPRVKAPLAGVFQIGGKPFLVSSPDASTVVVATPEIFAPFLEFFGSVPVLPKHRLQQAAREGRFLLAYGAETRPDQIVGAGPFRLKESRPGQFTLLERNPEYWATDSTGRRLPYLDEVRIVVAADAGGVAAQFLAGQCDVCERVRPEQHDAFQAAAAQGQCRVESLGPTADRDCFWFNQNTNVNRISGRPFVTPHKLAWFRNTAFRQAVSCALDRERIVREACGRLAVPCETYLGPESARWNNPNTPRFGFDRDRARALLAKAGLQDRNGDGVAEDTEGRPCEIVLLTNTGNPTREKIARLLVDDLRQIGVKLELQLAPFDTLNHRINEEFDYEAVLIGLSGGGADPASHLNVLLSSEPLHQWFPLQSGPSTEWEARIDTLLEAQMQTLDLSARKRAFDEVQVILAEQLPMIYTATPLLHVAVRTNLTNLRPSPLSPSPLAWNIEELWLRPR